MFSFFKKIDQKIIALLFLGIGLRLIYGLLFNQMVDYMNILSLVKSIADTGNFNYGLIALKRIGFEVQLYGKIYYQIIALWLRLLDWIGIVPIKYLFDTKPLTDPQSYMIGLWQWSPPLYQLTIIKLIQFLWDFLFIFFLYKTARLINKNLAWLSILFWALNPYFMMINYAFFMPEMFMLAAFVGGLYFWLRLFEKNNKDNFLFKTLAIFFLTLGAVIKQVPLLLMPFLMIFLIKRVKDFIIYPFLFLIFYLFLKQGWAEDGYFINKFFLFSKESMGILRNNFNNIPYFLYFFGLFTVFFLKRRDLIFSRKENIILLIIFVISLIYLNDPVFFIQFTIWILPFSFLLSLFNSQYWLVFNLSMLAITLKGWQNEMYLSPMLSPTIGAMFNDFLSNKIFINQFFDYEIYYLLIRFGVNFFYLLVIIEVIGLLFFNKSIFCKIFSQSLTFTPKRAIFFLFLIYIVFNIFDYTLKSSYVLLSQNKYQVSTNELELSGKPFVVKVINPSKKEIKAIQIPVIIKNQVVFYDNLVFEFIKNNQIFLKKKIPHHYLIGKNYEEPLIVFLPRTVKESDFFIKIYKEKGLNDLFVQKAQILNDLNKPPNGLFVGYEKTPEENLIRIYFSDKKNIFPIYFRGRYDLNDIFNALKFHTNSIFKKSFFTLYIITSIIIISLNILINFVCRKNGKKIQK